MKQIRPKSRVDHVKTEVRTQRGSIGKWVYLTLLVLMMVWLLDVFFGRFIYLQANGIVMRDTQTVSLSYTAQFKNINVRDGVHVNDKQLLGEVVSMGVIEQLSALTIKISDIDADISSNHARLEVIKLTLSLAKKRAEDMIELRRVQEGAIEKGLTNTQHISELLQDEYDSQVTYRSMLTERRSLTESIQQLSVSRDNLASIRQLTMGVYKDGRVEAMEAGIVTNLQIANGSVIKAGDKILDILYGEAYVLAYVEPRALYTISEGEDVSILFGADFIDGRVEIIYPLSKALPLEFQRSFRPLERSTVARISINPGQRIPPLLTSVSVYSSGSLLRWVKPWFN